MFGIYDPIFTSLNLPGDPMLDSELRFLGGVWFGVGIAVLSTVRSFEKHFELYKVLWGLIFCNYSRGVVGCVSNPHFGIVLIPNMILHGNMGVAHALIVKVRNNVR